MMSITVIIPNYNYGHYLAETFASIEQQSYQPKEIIVIDNSSTDHSLALLKTYEHRIQCISLPSNFGASHARNVGATLATSQYLAFLDADDLWLPKKLETQLNVLQHNTTPTLVFTSVQNFYSLDMPTSHQKKLQCSEHIQPGLVASTLMVSRDLFFKIGPFNTKLMYGEFIEWYHRAHSMGIATTVIPELLTKRRIHSGHIGKSKQHQSYCHILKSRLQSRALEEST